MNGNLPSFLRQTRKDQADKSNQTAASDGSTQMSNSADDLDEPFARAKSAGPTPAQSAPRAVAIEQPAQRSGQRSGQPAQQESGEKVVLEPVSPLASLPGIPPTDPKPAPPNPAVDIAYLDQLERHLYAHRYARIGIASYGPSIDPPDATTDRGEAQAILEQEDRELLCSPATGALLDRLSDAIDLKVETETQKAQVRILKRDRAKLMDVPADEQEAFSRLTTEAEAVWRKAKAADDWESFEPYLERLVEGARRIAHCKNPSADPYDVLLDDYEQGTNTVFYDRFFDKVKETVVPLLADVTAARRKPSRRPIEGHFDARRQWAIAADLVELEGLSRSSLFVTSTEHPYSDALTTNYAIIAGHVYEDNVIANVYSMLHEGGHALYEQGVNPAYNYTSLKGGTSSGMHEAQSRFFENYIGRDEAFAGPLIEVMRRHFPAQFNRVTARQLYLAVNVATPQPIRVEADELTYPLHILVRYEIERMLISGEATVAQVPALWAKKYREYLGVHVPNASSGVLQDTHWSNGLFGYFPTYALGGAYGAQLRHAIISCGIDWEGQLSSGDLGPIRDWLRTHVWRFGRSKDPADIIRDACGEKFNTSYYTDYLQKKFTSVYSL